MRATKKIKAVNKGLDRRPRKRTYSPKAQHPCDDFNRRDLSGVTDAFEDENKEEDEEGDGTRV